MKFENLFDKKCGRANPRIQNPQICKNDETKTEKNRKDSVKSRWGNRSGLSETNKEKVLKTKKVDKKPTHFQ